MIHLIMAVVAIALIGFYLAPLARQWHPGLILTQRGALTLTTADSALKEFYEPGIREQINNDIPLLSQIEKNTKDIEGRRAVLSLHNNRSAGSGARADGGTLPTAGQQGYAEERVPLRYNYGQIQISGPTIRAMRSDQGSFTRAVDSESKGITNDLKKDVNRQCWGTSDGVVATCSTSTTTTVINLASTTSAVQMRQFFINQRVDIGTIAQAGAGTGGRVYGDPITAVDSTNKTITITTAISTASTDFVFVAGSGGSGASQKELTGVQSIVAASGTLFNVAGTGSWVSYVDSNGGTNRSLSENLMAKAMQQAQIAGGVYVDIIICSDGVFRAFGNLLTSLKRFPQTVNLKGGYAGLDFTAGGPTVPVVWDRDAPANKMFGFSTQHLIEFMMSDWEFMQEDGAVLSRVAGLDAYGATLFAYKELATDKRNSHFQIADISEPA